MIARSSPLWLLLLLGPLPAHADLKITTRYGTGKHAAIRTRYIQSRNWREEFPGFVTISNADSRRIYLLDPAAREYTVRRFRMRQPVPAASRAKQSGKTVSVYFDTVDTGERRWMFGHLARHVIQSVRQVSEPGACEGPGELDIQSDGWYIDLPEANPRRGRSFLSFAYLSHPAAGSPQCGDHIEFHTTGPRETGYPLIQTLKESAQSPGARYAGFTTSHIEVTELTEESLDPKLFVPPPDFHLVLLLPGQTPLGFMNALQAGWSGLVQTVDALLH